MYDVIIIGSGPAGMSAAITCKEKNLSVLVIDEYMRPGGRLLGQLYEEPDGGWWNGIKESNTLYNQAIQEGAHFSMQTTVHNVEYLEAKWVVYTNRTTYTTGHLLIATGAAESPAPVPGWTLPGVMSVGAAQVMTNVQRVRPGDEGIVIGVDVLSAAIAMELDMAGIKVTSMTLPKPNLLTAEQSAPRDVMDSLLHVSHMAPSLMLRWGSKLMKGEAMKNLGLKAYPRRGFKMGNIPVQLKKAVTGIYGNGKVEGVTMATIDIEGNVQEGSEQSIPCDFVCISGGLYPLVELIALTGCPFYFVEELGGYVPLHSQRMETTLEGLYVAGNITGIEGAKVAIAQGTVAGLTIAAQTGIEGLDKEIEQAIEETDKERDNAYIQFHPEISKGKAFIEQEWKKHSSMNRAPSPQ